MVETIESVVHQSLSQLELILVNDGSTDDSGLICESFQHADSRIKYIYQPNSGVSIARNNGLTHAAGEYIFFMDSDDTLDSEFLKTSYEIAKKEDRDIVIIGNLFCKRMPNVTALPTWAQILKADFLKNNHTIQFPKYIQPCEDGLFSHQLLALTQNIGVNPDGIYHYRHHENQNHIKINENIWKVINQIPEWFKILNEFYTENNFYHSKALHLALFIEHEPFEFRYLGMPLNDEQKFILFELIKSFMSKVLPYLSKEEKNKLSKPFLYFINSNSIHDFESVYDQYKRRLKLKNKIYLFLIKFIPFKKFRRGLRVKIVERF